MHQRGHWPPPQTLPQTPPPLLLTSLPTPLLWTLTPPPLPPPEGHQEGPLR